MIKKLLLTLNHLTRFLRGTYYHFQSIDGYQRASALAFTSLLSLVPLMTVSLAILSAFPVFQDMSLRIQSFIFNNFVGVAGDDVQSYLIDFIEKARHLSAIGLIFLILTAISTMLTIENTFNAIWQVKQRRNVLAAFMLYWTILTVSPLLIGVGVAISSYLTSLEFFNSAAKIIDIAKIILIITPFILSVCAFTLIYMAVPNRQIPAKPAFTAAVIASIAFELTKKLFSLYITKFAAYQVLYGALAAIPVFLLWVYICWMITLFGAVMSFVLAKQY